MNEQLSLFGNVEDSQNVSSTIRVEDTKKLAIQRFLDKAQAEPSASVSTYKPNGRKVRAIHIRGGNVGSKLAKYRAGKLQQMIDRGTEFRAYGGSDARGGDKI